MLVYYNTREQVNKLQDGLEVIIRELISLKHEATQLFDGDVLHWRTFWEQFQLLVHNKDQLSNAEKLAYLKDTLKDGLAECAIQWLAQMAGTYNKQLSIC